MNILIIGGNGFIGSHLVDIFLKNGHKVRVFDYSLEKYRNKLNGVDYRIFSFDNLTELAESLFDIDIVYHLASSTVPSTSNLDINKEIKKDLIPSINLLDVMVKLKKNRLVFLSSGGAVYGNTLSIPIAENQSLNPISSYGIIKATIENYIRLFERLYGIKALIVRPSNLYGPRQGHKATQGVISTFLTKVNSEEDITVFGNGKSKKDYLFISDFVEACYKLSMNHDHGEYNIGSGIGTSVNEIIDAIKHITKKQIKVNYTEFKEYDVPNFILDIDKIKRDIQWIPETTLNEGINKYWNWIIEMQKNFK